MITRFPLLTAAAFAALTLASPVAKAEGHDHSADAAAHIPAKQLPDSYGSMNRPNIDEAALRRLFLLGIEGDSRAYKQFLGELSVLLRAYVRRQLLRMGRGHHDVEDIVQEALMAVHSRRHTYQSDLPVTAWAYAITRYKLIDHVRKSQPQTQDVELDEETIEIDDSEAIDASLAVQRMVSKLPESLRRPLEMIKLEGYSARDVAIVTSSSEVAVRVSLHRALKALSGLVSRDRMVRK